MLYQASKLTGVYLVNRKALLDPIRTASSLPAKTGLAYIPLYSPSVRRTKSHTVREEDMDASPDRIAEGPEFSQEELKLFEEWLRKVK